MQFDKRAQIQLGEGIAVVVIIIILLIIGIAFWTNLTKSDIEETGKEFESLGVVELAKTVSELPELRCYSSNTVTKVNCFDYYKLVAMQNLTNPKTAGSQEYRDFYFNYFKTSRITFQQLYPEVVPPQNENITIYDTKTSSQSNLMIYIPVIIENRTGREGKKNFGLLIVEAYNR